MFGNRKWKGLDPVVFFTFGFGIGEEFSVFFCFIVPALNPIFVSKLYLNTLSDPTSPSSTNAQ